MPGKNQLSHVSWARPLWPGCPLAACFVSPQKIPWARLRKVWKCALLGTWECGVEMASGWHQQQGPGGATIPRHPVPGCHTLAQLVYKQAEMRRLHSGKEVGGKRVKGGGWRAARLWASCSSLLEWET